MKKFNTTTRRSMAAAALALTIPLAACGGTPESAVVSSGSPVGAAPMSAVDEVGLIHGLTSEVAVPKPSSSPMSAAEEVQLIRSISAQTPEAPHATTPSGSSHQYR